MTSYQANFASHHTCARHVGFLLACNGIEKNTTKCPVTFYLVHTTIPNYNRVTRILAHTLGGNFKSFCEVNQKFQRFLFFSIPRHTKGNQAVGQNCERIGAHRVMPGNQGFWIYLYFRIRHSFAHVWTISNKMASFGVNIYRPSASEHGQNITNITMI